MAQANARTVYVQPTTGGRLEVKLPFESSVSNLKMLVAKRLKVPKDKIVLLHKNKQLTEGSLDENNITEGSKLILLPNVETGIMTQNPEQCVMQALETLNESQVDNFLAGRSPLNLTMRLGDHMMFIQLQLSTISSASNNSASSSLPTPPSTPTSTSPTPASSFSSVSSSSPSISSSISSLPSPPPSPQPTSPNPDNITFNSSSSTVFTEASRNLTQTLRQLSSSALTKKMNESCDGRCCLARKQGGAVIESMFHHGRGVFSGTFSGTLSPTLQDQDGKPRRNICTIIHILNDLLGASSHCNPSAQCLCSNASPSQSKSKETTSTNAKDNSNANEDKILREKVHHIQTMLKERRLNRSARREVRASPYPCSSSKSVSNNSTHPTQKIDSNGVFLSTINSECSEQKLMDFSSETAVA